MTWYIISRKIIWLDFFPKNLKFLLLNKESLYFVFFRTFAMVMILCNKLKCYALPLPKYLQTSIKYLPSIALGIQWLHEIITSTIHYKSHYKKIEFHHENHFNKWTHIINNKDLSIPSWTFNSYPFLFSSTNETIHKKPLITTLLSIS